jgi:F420-dependent oxidoreductase-like protein
MKIGLRAPMFTYPEGAAVISARFGRMAQEAEAAGFYSFWVMDHFFQIGNFGPKELEMLEGYSALTYAAALTSKVKLGTLVTGVTYRYPAILVKTVTTLDVLSRGRAYFGVGAAWNEVEHAALDVPFPPLKDRFEILEETLQMALQMWSGEAKPFAGKRLHLAETLNVPNSIQRPHPPIMIGGEGEQKTLRLVAKYADACNIFAFSGAEHVKQKYDVLRQRCEEEGRPYEEIEKTTVQAMLVTKDGRVPEGLQTRVPAMTPAQAVEVFHQLAEIGTDHAIVNMPNYTAPDALEIWASDIIPAVVKLIPAGR